MRNVMLGVVACIIGSYVYGAPQFYYIKNDTGVAVNIEVSCGGLTDTLAIERDKTARFFIKRCVQRPLVSVTKIGTNDSLMRAQKISLSNSYIRMYRQQGQVLFDTPLSQEVDDGTVETYRVDL